MTKRILSILLLIAVLVAGCNTTTEDIPTQISVPTNPPTEVATETAVPTDVPPPTPTELFIPRTIAENPREQAYLRAINASPDLGIVDVYIESLAIATNLNFGDYTEREGIVAGRYKLRILPTGSFLSDTPLYEEELIIIGEQSLIFVITGTAEAVTVTPLPEPNSPLPKATSRLLMINAIQEVEDLIMLIDGSPQTAVTPYLQISETTEYDTGRVDIAFQNTSTTLLETQLDLRERQNYTFILVGVLSRPDTIKFIILNSNAPGITEISIINASPSIGVVDIYFGNELITASALYAEISAPQSLLSGTYDISVYAENANPDEVDPIAGTQFIANPDEEITLIIVGEPDNLRFVIYRNNPQPTYDNRARITFINSLESVPNVVLSTTEEYLDQRLSYGRLSDTFDIEAGKPISLTWIQQLDNVQDVALENVGGFVAEAGKNYLYIFAARGFENSIILSLDVGTLGFDFQEEAPVTSVPSSRPTRIRLVNMWENRTFITRLDGTVIAEGIEYGKATNQLIITAGEHRIVFHNLENEEEEIAITSEFEVGKDYTVVAYNLSNTEGDILLIDDSETIITSATGGLRLIVLEADQDSAFGLGYSEPMANISQPDASEDFRRSLPLGIQQIIREVRTGSASDVQRLPTGTYNIRIIDNEEVAIAYTHTEYTIEPQILYNVFLREVAQTGQTTTIIIPYSP